MLSVSEFPETMSYLYETHLHTRFSSACAVSKGSEYIPIYQDLGYSGMAVTDHFYNGNTAVPRGLPWKEWVKQFCRGYEEARNEGERRGFQVLFGWEETFDDCDDYLIYGLDKEWLLERPEAKNWTRGEQYRAVKAAGGCVIQAHPFRQRNYIRKIVLSTGCVDAVEAANGAQEQPFDALAFRYAEKQGFPIIAGTDLHEVSKLRGGAVFGIYVKNKLHSNDDLAQAVCNGGLSGIKITEGRCEYRGDEKITLPVEARDENDRSVGGGWKNIL